MNQSLFINLTINSFNIKRFTKLGAIFIAFHVKKANEAVITFSQICFAI